MLTDSHAHLTMDAYDADRADVLARARAGNVATILNIALGPEPEAVEKAYEWTAAQEGVFLAVGVHPHDAGKLRADTIARIRAVYERPKVVAVGEVGLDYHHGHAGRETQLSCFGKFLDLALEIGRPVCVHSREAFEDTLRLARERDLFRRVGAVMHCFTGTPDQARAFLDLGAYVAFSGILTFRKADATREAARAVPLERMLIETDAPFLAPEPHRGKRNEPAFVLRVAETIAGLKGTTVAEVARVTSENARRLYRLPAAADISQPGKFPP